MERVHANVMIFRFKGEYVPAQRRRKLRQEFGRIFRSRGRLFPGGGIDHLLVGGDEADDQQLDQSYEREQGKNLKRTERPALLKH